MQASKSDPYLAPSFTVGNRLMRLAWGIAYTLLFRPSPRPMHAWRSFLLRCFGAKMGASCHIYPGSQDLGSVEFFLRLPGDGGRWGNGLQSEADPAGHARIISQEAYLCGATHDYEDPGFPLVASEISIGSFAWVCARATVQPGVSLGEGAVLATGVGGDAESGCVDGVCRGSGAPDQGRMYEIRRMRWLRQASGELEVWFEYRENQAC